MNGRERAKRTIRRSAGNRAIRRVFGRPVVVASFIILAIAVIHPAHGTGLNVCLWRGATDLPCPGCGLTRSVSCAVRGNVADSLAYHPFGIVVFMLLTLAAAIALSPRRVRQRIWRRLLRRTTLLNFTYFAGVAGFITFGITRAAVALF